MMKRKDLTPPPPQLGVLMLDVRQVAATLNLGVSTIWKYVAQDPSFRSPLPSVRESKDGAQARSSNGQKHIQDRNRPESPCDTIRVTEIFFLGEGKQPNVCSQLRSQYKNVLLKRL